MDNLCNFRVYRQPYRATPIFAVWRIFVNISWLLKVLQTSFLTLNAGGSPKWEDDMPIYVPN